MTDLAHEAARYADPVLAGSRAGVARAITLVESSRPDHRVLAQHMLNQLLPHADKARRIGITGVPGVGKSTFIDRLGGQLALSKAVPGVRVDDLDQMAPLHVQRVQPIGEHVHHKPARLRRKHLPLSGERATSQVW